MCRRKQNPARQQHQEPISHINITNEEIDSNERVFAVNSKDDEIPATVVLGHDSMKNKVKAEVDVFPDSGAGICLGGTIHLDLFGILREELIPCNKSVEVVGGTLIPCLGYIPATFIVNGVPTKQLLYVCEGIKRLFFGKRACIDVNILPETFPHPMNNLNKKNSQADHHLVCEVSPTAVSSRRTPPPRPKKDQIPFKFTESSVPQLKQYIIDSFRDSAFDKSAPFPILNHKPGHIHLKPDAIPHAVHSPIPVPHHEKDTVKAQLDDYVKRGIIKRVPIGTPVEWCAQMVVTHRKDGRPRITVDYQKLNRQCLRETHHSEPPFHLASRVPPGTKKTVLGAVDSYPSVLLDEVSQLLTTFITEWGNQSSSRVYRIG